MVSQREAAVVLGQCALAAAVLGTGCGRVPALPLPPSHLRSLLRRAAPQSLKAGEQTLAQQAGGGPGRGQGEFSWSGPTCALAGAGLRTVEAVTAEDLPC